MFNPKTLYALNKKDPDAIVYTDADGKTHRLTRADFDRPEEFDRWKSWSDQDFHIEDNQDQVYLHHTRSMNEAADTLTPDPETLMEQREAKKLRDRYSSEAILRVKALITEKQYRRLWMYCVDGMSEVEIACVEAVGQQRISKSILSAVKKIKKFSEGGENRG